MTRPMSKKIEHPSQIQLFDELVGDRIILRPVRLDDFEEMWEATQESRDDLRPWLPFADQPEVELRNYLSRAVAAWYTRESMSMAIVERETQRMLGNIGLMVKSWNIGSFEIGYWLRTSAVGHGYMTEAVRLVTDFAFNNLDAHRVMIRCEADNVRSAAVPQRLGFTLEGHLRQNYESPDGHVADTLVFSMIRSDERWPANATRRPATTAEQPKSPTTAE